MKLGTTFSYPYIRDYFQLSPIEAFRELISLKLDLVRLGVYWSESEKQPGVYDFKFINSFLDLADRYGQPVMLSIGMKAPRWPEFHLPDWTSIPAVFSDPEPFLGYMKHSLISYLEHPSVKYIQVENEPLDPSGPQMLTVPVGLLKMEVGLVRQMTNLPLVLTMWGNKTLNDERLGRLSNLGDIVGVDLYYQIPDGHGGYWGPKDSENSLKELIDNADKPVWISELQTNPWKSSPDLSHRELVEDNYRRAMSLGVPVTLFWGYEYWYYLKQSGNSLVWDQIRKKVPTK